MDGTLTVAQHDFDGIREALGLPEGLPILESLAKLPTEEATVLHQRLDEIELEIAAQSKPAKGAAALLENLLAKDVKIAILTRNNLVNIEVTLKAAGLYDYFMAQNQLSRDCTTPKPEPDGIHHLIRQWQTSIDDTIMIGDSIHDLKAGRNAKTATIYYDTSGEFPLREHADLCISQLSELMI